MLLEYHNEGLILLLCIHILRPQARIQKFFKGGMRRKILKEKRFVDTRNYQRVYT